MLPGCSEFDQPGRKFRLADYQNRGAITARKKSTVVRRDFLKGVVAGAGTLAAAVDPLAAKATVSPAADPAAAPRSVPPALLDLITQPR
jgi:hypothetical protein